MQDVSEKLTLILKLLSISRSTLASQLGVHKSVISRWLGGDRVPSAHNLAKLSSFIATRHPGFSTLDWERDTAGLAALFAPSRPMPGLAIDNLEHLVQTTATHARAYEGFFRTTRADPMRPGFYLREHSRVRQDPNGLLRSIMGSCISIADGWMMPHQSLVYTIATERSSGALLFGMFHHRPMVGGYWVYPPGLQKGTEYGFSYTSDGFSVIEPLGAISSEATGINDTGVITGWFLTKTPGGSTIAEGFVDMNGQYQTIAIPGATTTIVTGINNAGDIVGYYLGPDVEQGFIGTPQFSLPTTGFVRGPFAGFPPDVPEPATWVMLITGVGLVGAALRRARGSVVRLQSPPMGEPMA